MGDNFLEEEESFDAPRDAPDRDGAGFRPDESGIIEIGEDSSIWEEIGEYIRKTDDRK